jgi:hypothetical protein
MTTTEPILTKEQISLKYYEHNLTMMKYHVENSNITDDKQTEMVVLIDKLETLLSNYVERIMNINNDDLRKNSYDLRKNSYDLERIVKLELIEAITKF